MHEKSAEKMAACHTSAQRKQLQTEKSLSINKLKKKNVSQGCKLIRDEKGDNDVNPLGGSGACSPGNIYYI